MQLYREIRHHKRVLAAAFRLKMSNVYGNSATYTRYEGHRCFWSSSTIEVRRNRVSLTGVLTKRHISIKLDFFCFSFHKCSFCSVPVRCGDRSLGTFHVLEFRKRSKLQNFEIPRPISRVRLVGATCNWHHSKGSARYYISGMIHL